MKRAVSTLMAHLAVLLTMATALVPQPHAPLSHEQGAHAAVAGASGDRPGISPRRGGAKLISKTSRTKMYKETWSEWPGENHIPQQLFLQVSFLLGL